MWPTSSTSRQVFAGEFHPYTPQKTNIDPPKMMVSNRNRLFQGSIFRYKTLVFEGVYQQVQQYLPSPFCSCWWHASRNGQILQLLFWQIAIPWGPSYPTKNQQTTCFNSIFGQSWRQTCYIVTLLTILHHPRELLTKGCYVKQFHKQRGDSTFLGHDTSNIQEKTRGRNLGWQDGVRLNHYRVMNRLYAAYQVVGRIMPIKSVCVCLVLMCCTKVNSLLKE